MCAEVQRNRRWGVREGKISALRRSIEAGIYDVRPEELADSLLCAEVIQVDEAGNHLLVTDSEFLN